MRKLAFVALIMVVAMVLPSYAGAGCGSAGCGDVSGSEMKSASESPLVLALQGFAFKGKDFKTVKLGIKEAGADEKAAATQKKDSAAVAGKEDGRIALAGFDYVLKIVSYEEGKLAADLFRPSDFEQPKDAKQDKLRLPVPVGHMSISRSQPNPGNFVYLGSLRLNDEETKTEGEFELYLNDLTPADSESFKDFAPKGADN